MAGGSPWQVIPDGLALTVRLTPKGGRDSIDGVVHMADGRPVLKVRVRAAPSDGEANAALVRLLAKSLGVAAGQVSVTAGATAQIKRLEIAGAGPALAAVLARLVEAKA